MPKPEPFASMNPQNSVILVNIAGLSGADSKGVSVMPYVTGVVGRA
jgi:hypothetical protein